MNNPEVKHVNFLGDDLIAAKTTDGTVYAGVRHICLGIGLTEKQADRQIANIQKDAVLKRGSLKFEGGVFDPNNAAWGMELDYVPLWLAKIRITPAMQKSNPAAAEKLVSYQLKAKDALAAAFLHGSAAQSKADAEPRVFKFFPHDGGPFDLLNEIFTFVDITPK